jgi:hypothetical protein
VNDTRGQLDCCIKQVPMADPNGTQAGTAGRLLDGLSVL